MRPDYSSTPLSQSGPAPRRDRRPARSPAGRTLHFIVFALVVVALIVVYWLANLGGRNGSAAEMDLSRIPGPHSIKVEVINVAGSTGLAQRVTDELRSRGFDVVDYSSDRGRSQDRTVVIDRSGHVAAARDVASALGLPADRVQQRLDRKLYLDVTVLLGKDASSLGVIRTTSWKGTD